jgi:hypothetical protein
MTPTRALFGLAAVAAAGYVAIHSVSDQGPQYLGDFPSIMEQSQDQSPAVTHETPGPPVPDPPHYAAQPVAPEAPPPPAAGPPGPGPVPPAAPPGGGGTGGQGGYPPPGVGAPLTSPLPPLTDLLSGLPLLDGVTLPGFDPQDFCDLDGVQVLCSQIPTLPGTPPVGGVPAP